MSHGFQGNQIKNKFLKLCYCKQDQNYFPDYGLTLKFDFRLAFLNEKRLTCEV